MSKPWLTWAIDDPAPGNCGYSALNVPCEVDPSLRQGLVLHSVEGWFTYVSPSAVMAARGNSWGVTIMRSGQVWRHRPRPTFVNWHAGGPAQNVGTDGVEMEGKDQPWTPEQKASLLRVLKETWDWFGWTDVVLAGPTDRTQEGIRQALLAHGYGSLWEHKWFGYTTCSNGRDDWPWLMPALSEEDDDMPLQAVEHSRDGIHVLDGPYKVRVSPVWWEALKILGYKGIAMTDAQIDAIPERPQGSGGTSCQFSRKAVKEETKQAAREGTG